MDDLEFHQHNAQLAFDLYRQFPGSPHNLFFSPYSIAVTLAMAYGGARRATAAQMAQALHFPSTAQELHAAMAAIQARLKRIQEWGGVRLLAANAIFPQADYPFLADYIAILRQQYGVEVTPLNFSEAAKACRVINDWVKEQTQGQITDLASPDALNVLTRLVLVNAVYFKGDWASQFLPERTQPAPFWVSPGKSVEAPVMRQRHTFAHAVLRGVQVLELPYVGDDLAMTVLLPEDPNGLAKLEAQLTPKNLALWIEALFPGEVTVSLPKLSLSSAFRLEAALQNLGMLDAFKSGAADFSGMDGIQGWLYIAAALHQARVEVDEAGSQASASTSVHMQAISWNEREVEFRADHPFVFLIRERKSGTILFLGRVANPAAGHKGNAGERAKRQIG